VVLLAGGGHAAADVTGRRLSLTFDNGPTPGVTDGVLDVLGERGVAATFFVVGERLDAVDGRCLAERAAREGHWLGNHGLTHTMPLGRLDDGAGAWEIEETQRRIGPLAHPHRLFRPFATGGAIDERLLSPGAVRHLVAGGYTCVLWNSIPHDWDEPDRWVDRALHDVRDQDHTVVVVHDLDTGAMAHLGTFLDELAVEGVEVVQPFPDDCVPIDRGVQTPAFDLIPGFTPVQRRQTSSNERETNRGR
jgi:peptidoglycan/xylan/chitin deacetylase (PgdA/CDA1 family)